MRPSRRARWSSICCRPGSRSRTRPRSAGDGAGAYSWLKDLIEHRLHRGARRSLHRRARPAGRHVGLHPRLCRARGDAGRVQIPGAGGRGHVRPRDLRPHRDGQARGAAAVGPWRAGGAPTPAAPPLAREGDGHASTSSPHAALAAASGRRDGVGGGAGGCRSALAVALQLRGRLLSAAAAGARPQRSACRCWCWRATGRSCAGFSPPTASGDCRRRRARSIRSIAGC